MEVMRIFPISSIYHKGCLTIVCLLISIAAWTQSQEIRFGEVDTTSSITQMMAALPIVAESSNQKHIRIKQPGQVIDFYQTDTGTFGGTVFDFIKETESMLHYYSSSALPENMCESYLKRFERSGVPQFLEDSIKPEWDNLYFDCFGATIHSKWNDVYREQQYYCPKHQTDSLNYADTITAFLSSLDTNNYLIQTSNALFDSLPGGVAYTRNGFMFTYKLTEAEAEAWRKDKPRREYIDSISQFIDPYLLDEINKNDSDKVEYCDYSIFNVRFKKNGKFDKMRVANQSKYKMYEDGFFWFEERRELRQCKKYVKKSVRKIDLSSFNLEYDIVKRFTFIDDALVVD